MTDISKICMVCLGEKDASGICPNCRKDTDVSNPAPLLPVKSILAQRYIIALARKRNSEGVTYSAYDIKLGKPVSVREFYPESLVKRDSDEISVLVPEVNNAAYTQYLNSFISLWTKLHRLKGLTALITVTEVFQLNGTAYAVYDESERITLRDYLLETKEGFISWEKARIVFMPVLSTLGTLHTSGIIHKGINPSSFVFSKEGKLKLTDFCIAPARTPTGLIEPEFFDGYAPFEQYSKTAVADARSDIYSFCSVLYRSLIGSTPIDAKTRFQNDQMMIPAKFAEKLPPYVINALINGMAIEKDDRTENIEQLRSDLSASPRVIGASAPAYTPSAAPEKENLVEPLNPPRKTDSVPQQKKPASRTEAEKARIRAEKLLETEKKNKKKNTLIAALSAVLVILILGIGVLIFQLLNLNGVFEDNNPSELTTLGETVIEVPNFIGMKIADIISDKQYTDYFDIKTVETSSSTVVAGLVTEQSIAEKSSARIGDTIILTVSTGPKVFALADVTGMSYSQAESTLLAQGLTCKKSLVQNSDPSKANKVAETVPPAQSAVKDGDTIIIVVYTDPAENETTTSANQGGNSVEEFLGELENTTTIQF